MALNKITCGDCGKLWDECKCPGRCEEKEKQEKLKEQMRANGYELSEADGHG